MKISAYYTDCRKFAFVLENYLFTNEVDWQNSSTFPVWYDVAIPMKAYTVACLLISFIKQQRFKKILSFIVLKLF